MSIQETLSEAPTVKVLHEGSLTSLLRSGIGPALFHESGITLESESGHSVALAMAIKDHHTSGDVFMSADAEVNQILLGSTNGNWMRCFFIFARNAVVLAYSPKSRFFNYFEQARSGTMPWYQALLQPGLKLTRNDPNLDPYRILHAVGLRSGTGALSSL
jgi:molybdate/tungstate transport system substrate-binding protein